MEGRSPLVLVNVQGEPHARHPRPPVERPEVLALEALLEGRTGNHHLSVRRQLAEPIDEGDVHAPAIVAGGPGDAGVHSRAHSRPVAVLAKASRALHCVPAGRHGVAGVLEDADRPVAQALDERAAVGLELGRDARVHGTHEVQ